MSILKALSFNIQPPKVRRKKTISFFLMALINKFLTLHVFLYFKVHHYFSHWIWHILIPHSLAYDIRFRIKVHGTTTINTRMTDSLKDCCSFMSSFFFSQWFNLLLPRLIKLDVSYPINILLYINRKKVKPGEM